MNRLEKIIKLIETIFEVLTAFFMFSIMAIVTLDVIMRYFVNRPLIWAYDLIGLYMIAGVFFFSISPTYAAHKHIAVDILVQKFSQNGRRIVEIFTCLISIPLFILIAKVGAERAYSEWLSGTAIAGPISWPTWISSLMVPLGIGLLLLRLMFKLIGQITSLITGRNVVDTVPIIGKGAE